MMTMQDNTEKSSIVLIENNHKNTIEAQEMYSTMSLSSTTPHSRKADQT